MKYIVILGDGMADLPIDKIGAKTPLQAANKPVMDMLASRGEMGMVKTVPDGIAPGSDVANLSVMGYDPKKYYTGRSPLEAVSIGAPLIDGDVTYRVNTARTNMKKRQCSTTVPMKSVQTRERSLLRPFRKNSAVKG